MTSLKRLLILAVLGCGAATAAHAQSFSNVINFGDSLSDGGNFTGLVPGALGSFTTNPDPVAIKLIAQQYGFNLTPSGYANNGGWNFAWGGAPTGGAFLCVPTTLPCRSGSTQLTDYYARSGGRADPKALYSIWLGANDVFNALGNPATAQAAVSTSVQQYLGLIANLQAAGARTIVTYNLPDIGRTPFGTSQGAAGAASISQLVMLYNAGFNSSLAQLGEGIVPINTFALINDIMAAPAAFGFSNVTGTACNTLSGSLFCAPAGTAGAAFTYAAGANTSFLFADGVHPTGGAHRLLANVVIATLAAPGQVSAAGETALRVYDDHSRMLNLQFARSTSDKRAVGDTRNFASLQYGQQKYAATTNTLAHDGHLVTLTMGADNRIGENTNLGAAISLGDSRGSFAGGGGIGGTEVLMSGYGSWGLGVGPHVDVIASAGVGTLGIERAISMTATTRTDGGKTDALHAALEAGGGYLFSSGTLLHGPFVSAAWQSVNVAGYSEQPLSSTSMHFDGYTRKSLVGRLGYQLSGEVSTSKYSLRPLARVAYAKETKDTVLRVGGGSNSMNGHFTLDGYIPSKNWVEADVGVSSTLANKTEMSLTYSGRFNDDALQRHVLRVDLRKSF